MNERSFPLIFLVCCAHSFAISAPLPAQCVTPDDLTNGLPLNFDLIFAGMDGPLLEEFPEWQTRFNQENTADPTPQFSNEDNSANGIKDDDQLDLLAAILTGGPADTVLSGIPPATVEAIRASYAANRGRVRPDLTLDFVFFSVNIIDEVSAGDPAFGETLKDLVAGYMTLGDAECVQFVRGLLITLGEIFVERGVASGDIPAIAEGLVKSTLRSTVSGNFVASRYDCYGDVSGARQPNWLGDTGRPAAQVTDNETSHEALGSVRYVWLIDRGVTLPPLEIAAPPQDAFALSGEPAAITALVRGGTGAPGAYDWRRVAGTATPEPVSQESALAFAYPLSSDSGDYRLYVCDGTWVRSSPDFRFDVTTQAFRLVLQPDDQRVRPGNDVAFSVQAVGGEVLPSYAWQKEISADNFEDIPGADGPELLLTAVNAADSGNYRAAVTGGGASGPATTLTSEAAALVVDMPPTVALVGPAEFYLECGALFTDPGATASDDLDGDLTTAILVAGTVNANAIGAYVLTYSVTDSIGNTAQALRSVYVQDTTPPALALNGGGVISISCGSPYIEPGFVALDGCAGDLSAQVQVSGAVDTQTPALYLLTYTVQDDAGNTGEAAREVQVVDDTPPALMLLGGNPSYVECGALYVEPGAVATDACAGDLTASIDVTGTVDTTIPATYEIAYSVSDTAGNESSRARTVIVRDTTAPQLLLIGSASISLECGGTFADPGATADDACDGDLTAAIQTTGTVDPATAGQYTITYRVADSGGKTAQLSRTVRVQDTAAPAVTLLGAESIGVECGGALNDPGATAFDVCEGDLTERIVLEDDIDLHRAGTYARAYVVTDAAGNEARAERTFVVADTTPPRLVPLGATPLFVPCGEPYAEPGVSALDACDGDLGASVQTTGEVDTAMPGEYILTYDVRDGAGLTAQATRRVIVADGDAPEITLLGANPLVLECPAPFTEPGFAAQDACGGDFTAQVTVTGSVNAASPGTYALTYSVADGAGNRAAAVREVVVADSAAPELTLLGPNPVTVACGAPWIDAGATAQDACDGNLTNRIQVTDPPDTRAPGVYRVSYSVSDSTGNTATVEREVIVDDDCAIVITEQPRGAALYAGMNYTLRVRASGGTGPLAYAWQKDDAFLDGASSAQYALSPVQFEDAGEYRCAVTDGASTQVSLPALIEVFTPAPEGQHSADSNQDWRILLPELLRIIQFYNVEELSCSASTEDGYAPEPGPVDCSPHASDYAPQDWRITLTELLRVIQFYNTPGGAYHAAPGTEDGFAPGAG
ncbi:MAG: DUF5011 domain-containing protein [Candidatus Hydrogenedentes bacterium]|nr:DUF5011 domain-containing protein [Candidatus Hydrogenedentota bacterium]